MTVPTDNDLVTRARAGDRSAQKELVTRWQESVYQMAWRVLGNDSAAEDVRQIVFLRMIERPERLPRSASFASWIRKCTINEAITYLRRRKIRWTSELPMNQTGDSISPVEQAEENEEVHRLRDVLQTLPPEERAILTLRFDEDLSFPEIAEILNRPATTIK
ncbi:MAG: sigma-70 family RNA polymerase sigma factor, partial [Planctomycetaceae bacterium]|nr:sigma-70 family RNA polymerase sigma factor [Planctomycetaceae bacterium]